MNFLNKNKTVYIHGRCLLESRSNLQIWIQQQGGRVVKHISKKLDYFVIGLANSSWSLGKKENVSYLKARELNKYGAKIQIMSELDLLRYLGKRPNSQIEGGDFSIDQVCRLTGVKKEIIEECTHLGLLGQKKEFSYRDMVLINDIKKILLQGISLGEISKTFHKIIDTLDEFDGKHLSLFLDQGRVQAKLRGHPIQETGQYSFLFEPRRANVKRIRKISNDGQNWFRRGIELERVGRLTEAEIAYQKSINATPYQGISYYNLGNVKRKQGELERAIHFYRRAIEFAPDLYLSWYNLAYCYDELRQYEFAIECYHRVIKLNPLFANAFFNLGRCYLVLDRKQQTRKYWQKYLQLQPKGEWVSVVEEHLQ